MIVVMFLRTTTAKSTMSILSPAQLHLTEAASMWIVKTCKLQYFLQGEEEQFINNLVILNSFYLFFKVSLSMDWRHLGSCLPSPFNVLCCLKSGV